MSGLLLTYERDGERNFCGPLSVTVEANGFRGGVCLSHQPFIKPQP
jgi:hypothetical protein